MSLQTPAPMDTIEPASQPSAPPTAKILRQRIATTQRSVPVLQILALIVLFIVGAVTLQGFLSKTNLYGMLTLASFLGFAAAGQTLVVLIGAVDLSVPGMIALSSTMVATLTGGDHWPFVAVLAAAAGAALLAGCVIGCVCTFFGAEPLIVTLGMSAILTGIVQAWSGGYLASSPPAFLIHLVSPAASTFGVGFPPVVCLWAVLAIVVGFVLRSTRAGRRVYATGSNPVAARLALVPTARVWVAVFAASALLAALAGVLLSGFAAGDQSIGNTYLFESLAAVIVGGTAFGARGDYWRTVFGALILTEVTTLLIGYGYSDADQQMLYGAVILLVVAAYGRERRVRDRI